MPTMQRSDNEVELIWNHLAEVKLSCKHEEMGTIKVSWSVTDQETTWNYVIKINLQEPS